MQSAFQGLEIFAEPHRGRHALDPILPDWRVLVMRCTATCCNSCQLCRKAECAAQALTTALSVYTYVRSTFIGAGGDGLTGLAILLFPAMKPHKVRRLEALEDV